LGRELESLEARDESSRAHGMYTGDAFARRDALGLVRLQTGSGDVTCKCLLVGSRHAIISGMHLTIFEYRLRDDADTDAYGELSRRMHAIVEGDPSYGYLGGDTLQHEEVSRNFGEYLSAKDPVDGRRGWINAEGNCRPERRFAENAQ